MKWELDDNSRNGFQYLLFGALVIALGVGLNVLLDRAVDPIGPNGDFGHGYLIGDDGARTILAHTTRGERLATAVLLAFLLALLSGGLVAVVGRLLRSHARRWSLITARACFALSLTYFAYAALFLPPQETLGERDGNLILWKRNVLLNDLPWPNTKHITLLPFTQITQVVAEYQDVLNGERVHVITARLNDGNTEPLGNSTSVAADDTAAVRFANERALHFERERSDR